MREAGLPILTPDIHGEQSLLTGSRGVVRAVYPDRWRVDIETDDGSLLTEALVIGPYFPELHKDGEAPSHVGYLAFRGGPDAVCWPMPHRRLMGPHDTMDGQGGQDQPERRYFHLHGFIFRSGDITLRVTQDHRFVMESEAGDYILYDQATREIHLHAPTIFAGTDEQNNRIEYQQDESLRAFNPLVLLGTEIEDRIEYLKGTHILLQAPLVKVTADEIVLDPTSIKLGHQNATERVMLGDLFLAFYNTFVALFNAHQHTNVQTGGGISGAPTTPTATMTAALLSDVARVSKTGL
jgi:hypothetical protein